ncbi:MAG: LysR family transcriptional regulator [Gemmatimonadales bacterium]|nr:LysR family transcriptional regulator [Gemmatimonadales bacterium]
MLVRHLEYLIALAEERHFARAAARCGVTQPSLSAGLKQLEEELGLLLVQRGQRFAGFTAEGEQVLAQARRIVADVGALVEHASELRGGLVGQLRLGVIPTALPLTPLLTAPFSEQFPQARITVLSMASDEIQRGLDAFALDAGVTYLDNEPLAHVRAIPLWREQYLLFTAVSGPFGGRAAVAWRELGELPIALLVQAMQNRRIVDAKLAEAGVTPKVALETNSVLALCAHLRAGKSCAVLPKGFLPLVRDAGVQAIPLVEPDVTQAIGLVVPDHDRVTPSARHLVEMAARMVGG